MQMLSLPIPRLAGSLELILNLYFSTVGETGRQNNRESDNNPRKVRRIAETVSQESPSCK